MATTGAFITDPNLAAYTDEAAERGGLDPKAIESDHIISIRRSIGFLLSRWSNKGIRQWKFTQDEHTPAVIGENEYDLPVGTIDVQTVVLRRNGVDTEMYPISRSDYLILHDKNLTGRPDRYFIDRRRDTPADSLAVRMFFWLAAENLTDQIIANVYTQIEDAGGGQGTMDIPFRYQEAFVADLAARVAQKYKPEKYKELRGEAEALFKEADMEDQESAPLIISAGYSRRHGRR